jgi:hypothetical protein
MSLAAFGGCDLVKSATSTIIVSGLVIATPEIKYTGFFDVKSEVGATSWVGKRESGTSTEEPDPISGADVSVTAAGKAIALEETDQPGIYLKTSVEDANLVYQEGATYVFDAIVPGSSETHGGEGVAPPKLTSSSLSFEPALSPHPMVQQIKTHSANSALKVSWDSGFGRYAYVSVFRADKTNPDKPQQVFDTRPKTAKEVLDFVLGEPPTSVTVPAEVFNTDGLYALLLVAVNKGGPRTNTFVGSPYLVGSGAVELFAIGNFNP